MIPSPWDDIALAKLCAVVGRAKGEDAMVSTLRELDLASLASPDDLYRFAEVLGQKGGFVAAVGGLLSVHAVIHGATGRIGHES